MKTIEGYNTYILNSKNYLLKAIEARMLYLEIKTRRINHIKSKRCVDSYLRILFRQEQMVYDLKKKKNHIIHYAIHNLDELNCNSRTRRILRDKLNHLQILYTWTYSQTHFILQQKKTLNLEYQYRVNNKFRLKHFFYKIFKLDLKSNLVQEEGELYLTMKVFEHRNRNLFSYSKEMRKLEHFSHLAIWFLKAALLCNSLPIHGIGDLLSLPFWLLYALMQGYERTFKDYRDWKNTKHMNLKTLHKELEKIENFL